LKKEDALFLKIFYVGRSLFGNQFLKVYLIQLKNDYIYILNK